MPRDTHTHTTLLCVLYLCNLFKGNKIVVLQRIGGIETEVSLPCKSVKNPLFLVTMCSYWRTFWILRAGLWNAQIVYAAETTLDVSLYSNNQGLEGSFTQHFWTAEHDIKVGLISLAESSLWRSLF